MFHAAPPAADHVAAPAAGVLLVNLGTPDAPTAAAVRRYLAEFLWDPRVVEAPRALWWLALHGFILRVRPRRSARAYRSIWTDAGSPLLVQTTALADALHARLRASCGERVVLELAMTYGKPSIPQALERLRRRNVGRLLVLPLYPQYSGTTTGAVFDRVTTELTRWRRVPELRFVGAYCDDHGWVDAIAASVDRRWRAHGRRHLLFSFHSIPKRYVVAGDPYEAQCHASARLVAARLGLEASGWSVGFQSRFGREEWLGPPTDDVLRRLPPAGTREVSVVCPGFAADCLETLEEIALRYRAGFLSAGGHAFDYIPCLNDEPAHVALLDRIVRRHAQGWPGLGDAAEPAAATAAQYT